jgi:hypothetical protein
VLVRFGLVLAVAVLAGCTSSKGGASSTSTAQHVGSASAAVSTPSVSAAPTTAVAARSCPYAKTNFVHETIGMRLGRITVLRSAGRVVGCRFYALQGSPLHNSEHLPGPNQPALEITTQRYASAEQARGAFIQAARKGSNPQQVGLGDGVTGVCYQTGFDPKDHGADWACAINKGSTALYVHSVDTTGTFNTKTVTAAVLAKLPG